MITLEQYVGPHHNSPDWTAITVECAKQLLEACTKLEFLALQDGVKFPNNPSTGNGVSGQTFGGFRPSTCLIGALHSSHKLGLAVDRYDPDNLIDKWCFEHQDRLAKCGIYIEHPDATAGWSHWTTKAPGSGKRVFYP